MDSLPDESIKQRYSFVSSGGYVDMAKDYQSYLKDRYGQYLSLNSDGNAPVMIEVVGAVDKIRQVPVDHAQGDKPLNDVKILKVKIKN